MLRVLVGCEFSQIVATEFRKLGHDAWSCDLLDGEIDSSYHIKDDVLKHLDEQWDIGIFHPPCTFLTNAGVRHLHEHVKSKTGVRAKIHGKQRWKMMEESCRFFNQLKNANIKHIALENPIPHKYARDRISKYTQIIQPWQFGHKETKATCLWLKNLPNLVPTNVVGPPPKELTPELKRTWHRVHYASPGSDRWKVRSYTFFGIANAMATQWSRYCEDIKKEEIKYR